MGGSGGSEAVKSLINMKSYFKKKKKKKKKKIKTYNL